MIYRSPMKASPHNRTTTPGLPLENLLYRASFLLSLSLLCLLLANLTWAAPVNSESTQAEGKASLKRSGDRSQGIADGRAAPVVNNLRANP